MPSPLIDFMETHFPGHMVYVWPLKEIIEGSNKGMSQ